MVYYPRLVITDSYSRGCKLFRSPFSYERKYKGKHMTFNELHIIDEILKAIHDSGYEEPTPIQEQAIPFLLNRFDMIGSAQTGTGKTAAFALPILQHIKKDKTNDKSQKIRALILSPTRELANQIGKSFRMYGKYTNIRHTTIFGGVSQKKQEEALSKGVDILIATPGRLLDLLRQRIIRLDDVTSFVLDEADRMLDMGFIVDVREIVGYLPKKRQTMLFPRQCLKRLKC